MTQSDPAWVLTSSFEELNGIASCLRVAPSALYISFSNTSVPLGSLLYNLHTDDFLVGWFGGGVQHGIKHPPKRKTPKNKPQGIMGNCAMLYIVYEGENHTIKLFRTGMHICSTNSDDSRNKIISDLVLRLSVSARASGIEDFSIIKPKTTMVRVNGTFNRRIRSLEFAKEADEQGFLVVYNNQHHEIHMKLMDDDNKIGTIKVPRNQGDFSVSASCASDNARCIRALAAVVKSSTRFLFY
jgi:hypothetical protein